ncbi:MAG: transposase, partial [Steroidobacteraceae bacterium]|nr:transposase [Steroidobacteraceae bacterium]
PIHKLLAGRDPLRGEDLASQPTLSRFENAFGRADLYRMGLALADTVIERHRRRLKRKAKRITIDLDPTDDPTHGAQQLTFFNGHYVSDRRTAFF